MDLEEKSAFLTSVKSAALHPQAGTAAQHLACRAGWLIEPGNVLGFSTHYLWSSPLPSQESSAIVPALLMQHRGYLAEGHTVVSDSVLSSRRSCCQLPSVCPVLLKQSVGTLGRGHPRACASLYLSHENVESLRESCRRMDSGSQRCAHPSPQNL